MELLGLIPAPRHERSTSQWEAVKAGGGATDADAEIEEEPVAPKLQPVPSRSRVTKLAANAVAPARAIKDEVVEDEDEYEEEYEDEEDEDEEYEAEASHGDYEEDIDEDDEYEEYEECEDEDDEEYDEEEEEEAEETEEDEEDDFVDEDYNEDEYEDVK